MLAGSMLFALSFLPVLSGGRERWTTDQALAYQAASMQIQEFSHQMVGDKPAIAQHQAAEGFRNALYNFQALRTKLNDARSRSNSWAMLLRAVGIVTVATGAVSFLYKVVQKQRSTEGLSDAEVFLKTDFRPLRARSAGVERSPGLLYVGSLTKAHTQKRKTA